MAKSSTTITIEVSFCLLFLLVNGDIVDNLVQIRKNSSCDIWSGRWIYDDSYPLYPPRSCPFVENSFSCQKNGRPDNFYLKFRWQPSSCTLPRFKGRYFLRKMRGKRIMFVGDSLGLNQWQSLNCMLHSAAPEAHYTISRIKGLSTFRFTEYNFSVMLYRHAFLVDIMFKKDGGILNLNSMVSGKAWKGVDALIFNTWHWWILTGRQQIWDRIEDAKGWYRNMNRLVAYQKALNTLARWVDSNIDPIETKVFFQGVSPDHVNGSEWGSRKLKNCAGQRLPLLGSTYPGGQHPAEILLERVLKRMKTPIYFLNITRLSQLRKDGHPSSYGYGGHLGMDCTHWCLPGVPDTWNLFLYQALIHI